jgi:hypothetical protein
VPQFVLREDALDLGMKTAALFSAKPKAARFLYAIVQKQVRLNLQGLKDLGGLETRILWIISQPPTRTRQT